MKTKFILTAIVLIFVLMISACTKKSETQAAALSSADTNAKIMHGDLSDFAGTWVNGDGERVQLKADGMWGDDGIRAFDFKKTGDSANAKYSWNVLLVENDERLGDIYIVLDLFPSGVNNDIRGEYLVNNNMTRGIFPTDNTKDRIVITASIMSDSPFISSSVYYREGEYPTVQPQPIDSDAKFLTADISAFVGTWVTVHVHKMQIKANGRLQLIDNNLFYFSDDYETDVYIFPAGVEFVHWSGTVITDTTKDRVYIAGGSERTPTNDDVYYREGELPAGNNAAAGNLGGRIWHFRSGEWLYFFQHFRELSTIYFHSDGNVRVTSEEISSEVFGKWKITDDGRLEIRPDNQGGELNIPEVLYFSYQIRGNILTLTDNNPNFGKAGDEGTYYEVFPRG